MSGDIDERLKGYLKYFDPKNFQIKKSILGSGRSENPFYRELEKAVTKLSESKYESQNSVSDNHHEILSSFLKKVSSSKKNDTMSNEDKELLITNLDQIVQKVLDKNIKKFNQEMLYQINVNHILDNLKEKSSGEYDFNKIWSFFSKNNIFREMLELNKDYNPNKFVQKFISFAEENPSSNLLEFIENELKSKDKNRANPKPTNDQVEDTKVDVFKPMSFYEIVKEADENDEYAHSQDALPQDTLPQYYSSPQALRRNLDYNGEEEIYEIPYEKSKNKKNSNISKDTKSNSSDGKQDVRDNKELHSGLGDSKNCKDDGSENIYDRVDREQFLSTKHNPFYSSIANNSNNAGDQTIIYSTIEKENGTKKTIKQEILQADKNDPPPVDRTNKPKSS